MSRIAGALVLPNTTRPNIHELPPVGVVTSVNQDGTINIAPVTAQVLVDGAVQVLRGSTSHTGVSVADICTPEQIANGTCK